MSRLAALALAVSLAVAPSLLATKAKAAPRDYTIDQSQAHIGFSVKHLGVFTTHGAFTTFSGTIAIDQKAPENSRIALTIEAASLDTSWASRDTRLRSPEFFNVTEFPTLTFASAMVEKLDEKTMRVTGDFTMLGTTKPISIDFTLDKFVSNQMSGVKTIGLSGTTTIKRSEFGMVAYRPAVGDDVAVTINLAVHQK